MNWDELITIKDWEKALLNLLTEAMKAIQNGDSAKKEEISDLLYEYMSASPGKVDTLDYIALKAMGDLLLDELQESTRAIQSRISDLNKSINLVERATAQVNKDRKEIQLENVIESLNKAKSAIDILKGLEDKIQDPDQETLEKFRNAKESLENLEELFK